MEQMGLPLTLTKNSLTIKYPKLGGSLQSNFGKTEEGKSMTPWLLTILFKNGIAGDVRNWRFLALLNPGFKTLVGIML